MIRLFKKSKDQDIRPLVYISYQVVDGPWGGGNQFLKALSRHLQLSGQFTNKPGKATHILFNSHHHLEEIVKLKQSYPDKIYVHRIDGPIHLIRGDDMQVDKEIFEANRRLAGVSVFQSEWSLSQSLKLGFDPVKPIVIPNAVDAIIFNSMDRKEFSANRKVKLISTSWSDNPGKGGPIYKWLDENLNWNKLEYTFVGRCSEQLDNIQAIEPVPSEELADLLRKHDIYITASDNDPCSNALIEALSTGLPAIYFNRGGHPEIAGDGGLKFEQKEEIPQLIESIVNNYQDFQDRISVSTMDHVASRYISSFGE